MSVFALMGFCMFYQSDVHQHHTTIKSTLFLSTQKPLWTLCLCWTSLACLSGKAGTINTFLSPPVFQILSKVTYSTYLIHFSMLAVHIAQMKTFYYFSDYEAVSEVNLRKFKLLYIFFFRLGVQFLIYLFAVRLVRYGRWLLNLRSLLLNV